MSVAPAVNPRAFYNEIEPYAVRWLRNLENEGLIANGVIEDRSIRDLTADELRGYTQCHFFAGIGIWQLALTLAGWPDELPVWTGSCPCQPFSAAGAGKGVDDDRHLWPDWFKLIEQCRPPIIFGEQVSSSDGLEWLDVVCTDLERAGYTVGAADLCAAGVGAPHLRQRLYFMAYANDVLPRLRILLRETVGRGARDLAQARRRRQANKLEYTDGVSGDGFARVVHRSETALTLERALDRGEDHRSQRASETRVVGNAVGVVGEESRNTGSALARILGDSNGTFDASAVVDMADTASSRRTEGRESVTASGEHGGRLADYCGPRIVEYTDGSGSQGWRLLAGNESGEWSPWSSSTLDGATRGFWHPADWILCRPEPGREDWRWRAVEPGTFPLAHGDPARVGKLRAYGNAITEPLAQEFIETVIELLTDDSE